MTALDSRFGVASALALFLASAPATAQVDVPLSIWTNVHFPNGFDLGLSLSASFGDYNADGWTDLLSAKTGRLWRNEGGLTWTFVTNTSIYFNQGGGRYGAAWGDFDLDGLPDFADEPRTNACIHLMRNFGGGEFRDFGRSPQWFSDPACGAEAETNCWGDVDGDHDLDLFVPIYPAWGGITSIGNHFYTNAGPTGSPPFHLTESTTLSGLDNPPPDSSRPEGAEMVDLDGDGDLDIFTGGTLFQNRSTLGVPRFEWMTESGSGILFHNVVDEGAAFGDYDMDGDMDLYIAYVVGPPGVRIWENRGDGTFRNAGNGVVQNPGIGLLLGLSIADWDGDGDLDFTTRNVFRRNMLMETGVRSFVVATHNIDPEHITDASPAWADWDKDGDLDACLGFDSESWLYENTTYTDATPDHLRRFVRVKPIHEHMGTRVESEYGAVAEVFVYGEDRRRRRIRMCTSAGGYVNQNEYPLTFGLPADRTPEDPDDDLSFDLTVTFPSLPEQGKWRVDRSVNPILGDIALADLSSREIIVLRDGDVEMNGIVHPAVTTATPRMTTLGGELPEADTQTGLRNMSNPPTPDHWVGIEFDTNGATGELRLRDFAIEAHLGGHVDCGPAGLGNILLFDVTGGTATLVPGGVLKGLTSDRNRRTFMSLDIELEKERTYRMLAHVTRIRASVMSAPAAHTNVTLNGAFDFAHPGGCPDQATLSASLDTTSRVMTVRVSPR